MTVRQRRLGDAMSLQRMSKTRRCKLVRPSNTLFSKPGFSSSTLKYPWTSKAWSFCRPALNPSAFACGIWTCEVCALSVLTGCMPSVGKQTRETLCHLQHWTIAASGLEADPEFCQAGESTENVQCPGLHNREIHVGPNPRWSAKSKRVTKAWQLLTMWSGRSSWYIRHSVCRVPDRAASCLTAAGCKAR